MVSSSLLVVQGILQSLTHSNSSPLCLSALLSCGFFCCFLFSRSSRQLGAEIGQSARAVCPLGVSKTGAGSLHGFSLSNARSQQCCRGTCRVQGLRPFCKWFDLWFWHSCVCVPVCECVCVCVASWLNCGSSFRFCGSHNLCALYALPKSWLGGELELHLELLLCNVRMCAGGGWGAEWSEVECLTLSSESCARFEWQLRRRRLVQSFRGRTIS